MVTRRTDVARGHVPCSDCALRYLCLPQALGEHDIVQLERLVRPGTSIARGQPLFGQGDSMAALYAVQGGSFKTMAVDEHGLEQVMGFYYPGELLGLDSVADLHHHCSAIALESSMVCRIPYDGLDRLLDCLPQLRQQLTRLMSRALSADQSLLLTLGRKSSEGRIASLLLTLSHRRSHGGVGAVARVPLPMSRADLANFLSMRVETLSRMLRGLDRRGVIRLHRDATEILDRPALEACSARPAWSCDQ